MTKKQAIVAKKRISRALKGVVHPDNPLAFEMNKRYRELDKLEKSYE